MFTSTIRRTATRSALAQSIRAVSTLQLNPHIYVFHKAPTGHILSLLPTDPPVEKLAIGTTTAIPATPDSLTENPQFLKILDSVLSQHASSDPNLRSQAAAFASTSGSFLGGGGGQFFPQQKKSTGDGAGGASSQGGAGGGGRGGWVHLSDERAPPDYGRIAWPEDIFGSLEVDNKGEFVEGTGNWQKSGTYRVVTKEGILGLSGYLRGKVVERLREEEEKEKEKEKDREGHM